MARRGSGWRERWLAPGLLLLGLFLIAGPAWGARVAGQTAAAVYPDLRTLAPSDLRFDAVVMADGVHNVLRLSNTVANLGQGPLELVGELQPNQTVRVTQNIYGSDGALVAQHQVGYFEYDPDHGHWHYRDFAWYQLYTAAGGQLGQALTDKKGVKTGFCLADTVRVQRLTGAPRTPVYTQCSINKQGISVGWGDVYTYSLPEQWIDLGLAVPGQPPLPDGDYAVVSTADPLHKLWEGNTGNNNGVTFFRVKDGRIRALK
jgi:hypothetical protein